MTSEIWSMVDGREHAGKTPADENAKTRSAVTHEILGFQRPPHTHQQRQTGAVHVGGVSTWGLFGETRQCRRRWGQTGISLLFKGLVLCCFAWNSLTTSLMRGMQQGWMESYPRGCRIPGQSSGVDVHQVICSFQSAGEEFFEVSTV